MNVKTWTFYHMGGALSVHQLPLDASDAARSQDARGAVRAKYSLDRQGGRSLQRLYEKIARK